MTKINNFPIKRVVPLKEVAKTDYYWDMADLAKIFNHEIVEMENGVWRWKLNTFVGYIQNTAPVYTPAQDYGMNSKKFVASLDLNALAVDLHRGVFEMEEWMKFYMQIGYSLSGYAEVFGQHEASEYNLPGAKPVPEDHNGENYVETIIDYMRRIHKGKVLKL